MSEPMRCASCGQPLDPPGAAAAAVSGVIGPYHLLQVLGEGGMGLVYLAEQREPLVRRVALKLIKPGMDTRDVLAPLRTKMKMPANAGNAELNALLREAEALGAGSAGTPASAAAKRN